MNANDNNPTQDWRRCKYLHNNWHQYEEIKMTAFGPVGIITGEGFYYLDPEMAAWRAS